MTEIERMAREAGCFTPGARRNYWAVTEPALERFAELVRADERERCAKAAQDRDAARYRWLRSAMPYHILCDFPAHANSAKPVLPVGEENWPGGVDEAVDAAMKS